MSAHHHSHENDHSHGPSHAHAPASFGRAFAIGIGLNKAFMLIEAGYGLATNSVALLADAGHSLSDVLGLVAAWIAAVLPKRPSFRSPPLTSSDFSTLRSSNYRRLDRTAIVAFDGIKAAVGWSWPDDGQASAHKQANNKRVENEQS